TLMTAAGVMALMAGTSSAQELIFPVGEGDFNWASYAELEKIDLDGEQVTVFGPWLGPDQALVENVLAYFGAATGADVR
ncbi:hypothetical protein SB770_35020, partial [Pseudomonas sp. SIMBA_044]